jgi:hypothetical protein
MLSLGRISLVNLQRFCTRLRSVQNGLNIQGFLTAMVDENFSGYRRGWRLAGSRVLCNQIAKRHEDDGSLRLFPPCRYQLSRFFRLKKTRAMMPDPRR